MAKHRELASIVSDKIWRTVVVAGAMLGVPTVAACGGGSKHPAVIAPAADNAAEPAAAGPEAADKQADDEAAAKATSDKAAADAQAVADKEAADKEAAEQAAKPKRPRGGGDRPTGRGFILS